MAKDEFKTLLGEMLDLAGVPLEEQETDLDMPPAAPAKKEEPKETPKEPEPPKEKETEKDEEPEEELEDEWEKDIRTSSKFKVQFHENYIYVWYRNKKSQKIQVPPKLKPYYELVSELFEKIMAHVEKVS